MKGLPFLIGSTSYVIPADIIPNVKKMAPLVDDIELILFESFTRTNLPSLSVIRELRELKRDFGHTYTVHLPLDIRLGDSSPAVRRDSISQIKRIIDLTSPIGPFAYICHLNRTEKRPAQADKKNVYKQWSLRCFESLSKVLPYLPHPRMMSVENIECYEIGELIPFLECLDISICLDIGHIWKLKGNPIEVIESYPWKIRVIHLHGVDGRDHTSIRRMPEADVFPIFDELIRRHYLYPVTLEVFSEDDFNSSLDMIKQWWGQRGS
ncbi:MAG: sugar phosphate isomerase/epimerase [Spirochaetales bacterium]|nr:sugar phosphate isomerase/epimerase [Spirochaetales bacterium]